MYKSLAMGVAALTLFLSACNAPTQEATPDPATVKKTIQAAYIYGLPLVIMDISRQQMADTANRDVYAAPNTIRHKSAFPDATFRSVVRPNADTYYSIAWFDLKAEAVVLSVPSSGGRYYMLPMMDMYSNVFAAPGTRTTGNDAKVFLLTGPGYTGEVPAGMEAIPSPTNGVWLIGRTQVNSKEDGEQVVIPFQQGWKTAPLSHWLAGTTPPQAPSTNSPKGDPNTVVKNMSATEYFTYLNTLLAEYPAPAADSAALRAFAPLGIGAGLTFDAAALNGFPADSVQSAIDAIYTQFEAGFAAGGQLINGWNPGRPVIGTYGTDYLNRALVALFGLGANLREDAVYPSCSQDANGQPLDGNNSYSITFPAGSTPPAKAFWSLTMYDAEGFFIDNPINRYAIGDRSGLKPNADGSITIYIQHASPGKDKEANWLPSPKGAFNLLMRVYWPGESMLNGTWTPPAVVKI